MKLSEFTEIDVDIEEKASRKLCKSQTPDHKLGASNLSSCVAQGLRSRKTDKSQLIGKKRKKLKGKMASTKYGGPVSPTRAG